MTSVFKIYEEFCYAAHQELLRQNHRLMSDAFPKLDVEFFYYIKSSEPDRYFIIRIRNAERAQFIDAAQCFAENMCFVTLSNNQVNQFLHRTPKLDDYR